MASKNPGKGSQVKNPKPQKKDEENPEDLETLIKETDKPNCKTVSYTRLSTGQWVTKGRTGKHDWKEERRERRRQQPRLNPKTTTTTIMRKKRKRTD